MSLGRRPRAKADPTQPRLRRGRDDGLAELLGGERWLLEQPHPTGPLRILLAYPSPYPLAAASLGYQTIYRTLASTGIVELDRAWLPDPGPPGASARPFELRGVRTGRPAHDFHLIAISLAYELELPGVIRLLTAAGLAPLAAERDDDDPLVLLGGPITAASAELAYPFIDLVLHGEAEHLLPALVARLDEAGGSKPALLEGIGDLPFLRPTQRPAGPPVLQRCPAELLPAVAAWASPRSSFGDMVLVEAGRGCDRGCRYCVMCRSSSGGLRLVPADRVLEAIPPWATKVGLVGAAVTDHPELPRILETCAAAGRQVGLSSLRADRLDEQLVALLAAVGTKTLTTALDGLSERVRRSLHRGTRADDVRRAAALARQAGIGRFKLYLMVGVPDEEEADLQEGIDLCLELSALLPLTLTVSPFVPKPRTELAAAPFAGVKLIDHRLRTLERGLHGRAKLQSVSGRWAWVEWRLAQSGEAGGHAALRVLEQGETLAAWEAALR